MTLLQWLDDPASERGISFYHSNGGWARSSYDELAASTIATSDAVAAAGPETGGEVVPILLSTGPKFVSAFFGVLRAGHTPCPLAPPTFLDDRDAYLDHLGAILAVADPALAICDPDLTAVMRAAAGRAGSAPRLIHLGGDARGAGGGSAGAAEIGLLQFTSGSSGRPRGVQVGTRNLEANMRMIGQWLELEPGDAAASWLPLYHDMGLIGAMLTPVARGMDAMVMAPEQFVREPRLWLECLGKLGATCTASPSFGFAYVNKRLREGDLDGLDLSGWRIAIAGAERLDVGALARFARFAARAGFRAETFAPAFGMAEATLAVTGVPLDEAPRALRLDWSTVRLGRELRLVDSARLDDCDRIGDGIGWVLDCGTPLDGVGLRIVDESGEELPERHLGEIVVSGPTVALGYCADGRASGDSSFHGDSVTTGDAGFVEDGRLYVLGRMADGLSLRGRNIYAEDLDVVVAGCDGVSRGRSVVFTGLASRGPAIVAVVEGEPGSWTEPVGRSLSREVGTDAVVYVLAAGHGGIARTSSGKPRRREMFRRFVSGELDAATVWTNDPEALV
jgi:fatty-acyl-CoA synthase